MIPFCGASRHYSQFLGNLLSTSGEDFSISLQQAGTLSELGLFPEVRGKDQARALLPEGRILSVPVQGGASALKRRDGRDLPISGHGRWQEVHLGTWKALYGKTPFFPYLFPEMERIYREKSSGSLGEFTEALHRLAIRWLGLDDPELVESLRQLTGENPHLLDRLAGERAEKSNPDYSIFDTIFRFGREGIFLLYHSDLILNEMES